MLDESKIYTAPSCCLSYITFNWLFFSEDFTLSQKTLLCWGQIPHTNSYMFDPMSVPLLLGLAWSNPFSRAYLRNQNSCWITWLGRINGLQLQWSGWTSYPPEPWRKNIQGIYCSFSCSRHARRCSMPVARLAPAQSCQCLNIYGGLGSHWQGTLAGDSDVTLVPQKVRRRFLCILILILILILISI